MTSFNEIVPVFPVRDLAAAIRHYDALGFDVSSDDDQYAFAMRDQVHIHLVHTPGVDPDTNTSAAYLYVGDAESLATTWAEAGVAGRIVDVVETPYGLREGAHVDPDGNLIRFGSWIDPTG